MILESLIRLIVMGISNNLSAKNNGLKYTGVMRFRLMMVSKKNNFLNVSNKRDLT